MVLDPADEDVESLPIDTAFALLSRERDQHVQQIEPSSHHHSICMSQRCTRGVPPLFSRWLHQPSLYRVLNNRAIRLI